MRRLWHSIAAALLAPALHSETLSMKPAADTTLFETNPDGNMGGASTLVAGTTAHSLRSRALLRFDLGTNLPPGAVINTVSLDIQLVKQPLGAANSTFELRRVASPWTEGAKTDTTGAAASPGETTWLARSAPSTLWTEPGGAVGTDFATAPSATLSITGSGPYSFPSTPSLVADVQAWLDHPDSNFGWVLLTQSEQTASTARRIAAREDAANAPVLRIDYSPATVADLQMSGIVLRQNVGTLTWSGGTPPFQPQFKRTMSDTNWVNLGALTQTNTVDFPLETDQAFFRVLGQVTAQP